MDTKKHNFDVESRYCPACDTEYRAEISHCADCGARLISGVARIAAWKSQDEERRARGREITASDVVARVLIGKLRDLKAAGTIVSASGIAFRISAAPGGCGGG
ncbi:MAG: hypothetical protein LBU39_00820 [Desulfobulbaceae bacterium]|nr:hypothetical protein [Desulfobulbaceae bacterium]